MSDVAIQSFIQCLHLKAMMSPKYTESEPVRRSRRGTVNVRQERKQPECRVVYEQTLNLKLKGSKDCLDNFPQYNIGFRPIQSHTQWSMVI